MLAGWSAIAVAVLTVTGLVTLFAFFGTGSSAVGAVNDLNTIAMALATVPVALALYPFAVRTSSGLAAAALAAGLVGVAVAVAGSGLLLARIATSETVLALISVGNGLIGVWLLVTAMLLLRGSVVPVPLGWLGVAGGAGLAVAGMAYPLLGREHPVTAIAGLPALVGLVGFFGWTGWLLLQSRFATSG